ncbi:MAG: MMPL family transporter [Spirochaetales bacterium]|nr:MMPL family transporter [Spirochaetales bacterium]
MHKHQKRRDIIVLSAFLALCAFALSWFPHIYIDSSTDVFIPKSHKISRINDHIEKEFGSLDSIMIGIKVNFGTVLEPEVLSLINELTSILETDPDIGTVISLTNTDYIESSSDGMEVVPLLEDLSENSIALLKQRLIDWQDAYLGTIISRSSKLAVIIVQPASGTTKETNQIIYDRIRDLTAGYESANISFPIAGLPVVKHEINRSVMTDITYLIPIAAILILGVMFISFRRIEGVLYPLLSLVMAGIWIVGILGLFRITFTMATMLVPVLLLVVGSAYGIHVMSHFYDDINHQTGKLTYEQVCVIIRESVGKIRLSVILAGATTAGGFISQLSSPLGPFRVFGVLSALGVVFAQISTLILIPLLLRLRYRKGIDTEKFHKNKSLEDRTKTRRIFTILEKIVTRGKWPITLFSLLFIGVTFIAVPRIKVGTDMIDFFRSDSQMALDTNTFNNELSGTGLVSGIIEAPEKGDVFSPDFLEQLERFEGFIKYNHPNVPGIQTVVPSIKRINKVMNYDRVPYQEAGEAEETLDFFAEGGFFGETESSNSEEQAINLSVTEISADLYAESLNYNDIAGMLLSAMLDAGVDSSAGDLVDSFLSIKNFQGSAFDELPREPAKYGLSSERDLQDLVSQYMVLYSGSLDYVINDSLEPDKTLISMQLNKEDREIINPLRDNIKAYWDYYLPEGWSYSIGGGTTLALVLSELVTKSQYYSLIGALIIVWIIVSIMFRSPMAGLMGMIPVVYALLGIFSFMVVFQFSLDIITSLLASLAIGIGVDYAIHYMNAYKRCIKEGETNPLRKVYRTTGSAIFFNALSVAFGFLGLLISRFIPIQQLGILFSVSMVCACLASLIVLPMVLEITKPRFLRK